MKWLAVVLLLLAGCGLSNDQQTEYNYLQSAVRDLDHQTDANATILRYECAGYVEKGKQWSKIPKWGIKDKVSRYLIGCETLNSKK